MASETRFKLKSEECLGRVNKSAKVEVDESLGCLGTERRQVAKA